MTTTVAMPPVRPISVTMSANLWLLAVAAGVFETVLAVSGLLVSGEASAGEVMFGLGLRGVVFGAAVLLVHHLRKGSNWARLGLAVLLGGFGTISLVIGPIGYLMDGGSVGQAIASATAVDWAFWVSRVLHLAAVWGAMVLMFQRPARDYFASA
ncbi:hypothetical protein OIE66_00475 [Nonomuraea sp. NBC_01738]|uniref:hypothetical protein n=1 Tax=Nonomuraea sp. NBC_01738 TaxID=2976003 RepID=UPI002E117B0A|nr:hypothetical protein OIE66_00475 [Nonomuraea sp. NBC_01738]